MMAKMKLIQFLSSKLNEFLWRFQTDQPMVPFLAETLENTLRSITNTFISSDTMSKEDTLMKLTEVDRTDKNSYKSTEAIDVGMGANMHVSKYKKSSCFEKSALDVFFEWGANYIVFLMKLCSFTMMVLP